MSFWNFIKDVAPIAATIYGASQTSKASNAATQQANQANKDATQIQLKSLEDANRNLEVNRAAASPGLLRTQEIIARGSTLTPEQIMAVEDSRREGINALKGSSLRGSARATSAIVNDIDTRQRNNFMATNQSNADSAAKGLATQYFGAGADVANLQAKQGTVASQGLINSGNLIAQNTLGQAATRGNAIGDISAILTNKAKQSIQDERDQNYGNTGSGYGTRGTTVEGTPWLNQSL